MLLRVVLLACCAASCLSYKILGFFPFHSKSHHNIFAPIVHALARKGHQVIYLTPVKPEFTHENLEVRLIEPYIEKIIETFDLNNVGKNIIPIVSHTFTSSGIKLAAELYGDPQAQKIIHGTETFDAVLAESYFVQEPVSALLHKFGCVMIEVSSLGDCAWINELAGLPNNPSYQVDFKVPHTDKMGFGERIHNLYATLSTVLISYYYLRDMQGVMDKYFNYSGWERRPPLTQLVSNRSMILLNQDTALAFPNPLAPHVKTIGGLNIVPNKPLPKDIQRFMDESKKGVIYFSLGSNLQMSELTTGDFGKAFMTVFRDLPYNVLMKWENDETPNFPANVKTFKWFPQQDVLAHKNCLLFITHGGYLGLTESVYHGVPMVGIPFFGDQEKNLGFVVSEGLGVKLLRTNITTESVFWAITEVLNNPRYKLGATRRSQMMRDRRHSGLEDAVYWVEHAIKYPNSLTPRSAFMSAIEVHLIDITLILLLLAFIVYKFLRILYSLFKRKFHIEKIKVN